MPLLAYFHSVAVFVLICHFHIIFVICISILKPYFSRILTNELWKWHGNSWTMWIILVTYFCLKLVVPHSLYLFRSRFVIQKGLFMYVRIYLIIQEEKRPDISVVSNIRQTNTKRYELTRSKDYAFKLLCSKQFSSYRIRWLEDNFQTLERPRRGKSQVDSRPNLICECQHVYLIMSFSKWQYYWECIMKSIH